MGTTPDRTEVTLRLEEDRTALLVGDAGAGKTTLSRFVARWWAADPDRTVRVFSDRPLEWADLMAEPAFTVETVDEFRHLATAATRRDEPLAASQRQQTLFVLDGLDEQTANELAAHASCVRGPRPPMVLTSLGDLPEGFVADITRGECWAVLPITRDVGAPRSVRLRPDVDPAQGRLDWPAEARALIPDLRGLRDFPSHRWLTAAFSPDPSHSAQRSPVRGQRRTVARAGQWSLRVVEYR